MSAQLQLCVPTEPEKLYGRPEAIEFALDSYSNKRSLTHNFHPYPAKFVPQIPRAVIKALSRPTEVVLDPFCGSGTTLVEASVLGRQSIGYDVNPLACLISSVKTTPLTGEAMEQVQDVLGRVRSVQSRGLQGKPVPIDIPEFLNRDHWFQPHVQRELGALRAVLLAEPDSPAVRLLKVAFASIVVKVSNQESDTRWVAVAKAVPVGAVANTFLAKVGEMMERMGEFNVLHQGGVKVEMRSVVRGFGLEDRSVHLVVTSPPYLNSYDYYLYHKLRCFWLGFDHYSVQTEELGSRNRHSDKAEGVESYQEGMSVALREMRRVLKPGGFVCMVIGDSILKGKIIDMKRVFATLGGEAGLLCVHTFSYEQRKYTTSFTRNLKQGFKRSHIMFFKRTD